MSRNFLLIALDENFTNFSRDKRHTCSNFAFMKLLPYVFISLFLLNLSVSSQDTSTNLETTNQDFKQTLIIDIENLNDEETAYFQTALFRLRSESPSTSSDSFLSEKIPVRENDDWKSLIINNYGYSEESFPITFNTLKGIIKTVNNRSNDDSLKPRETLVLPKLITKPGREATTERTQVYSILTDEISAIRTSRVAPIFSESSYFSESSEQRIIKELPDYSKNKAVNSSTLIIPSLSKSELNLFFSRLPSNLQSGVEKKIAVSPGVQDVVLNMGETSLVGDSSCNTPEIPSSNTPKKLKSIPDSSIGKYYLLDFFKNKQKADDCDTHGNFVYGVTNLILKNYQLPNFEKGIEKKELSFYDDADCNIECKSKEIEKYYKIYHDDNLANSLLKTLMPEFKEKSRNLKEKTSVPILYLQALNYNYINDNASVISSSCFMGADTFKWLPPNLSNEGKTSILTAVKNCEGENTLNCETFNIDNWLNNGYILPLREFWENQNNYGLILVGAERNPGQTYGMVSLTGEGVTTLGHGTCWGELNGCLHRQIGTSLATPEIATLLFIAKAYWRSRNKDFSAVETRLRLLLASDINEHYAKFYASAGIPKLSKLLASESSYVVDLDNEVSNVEIKSSSTIRFKEGDFSYETPFTEKASHRIQGLQIVNGNAYVFDPSEHKWKLVTDVNFKLSIVENGVPTPYDFDEFAKKYKEIVAL